MAQTPAFNEDDGAAETLSKRDIFDLQPMFHLVSGSAQGSKETPAAPRPLKFVTVNENGLVPEPEGEGVTVNLQDYIGWQKVNETTVMERVLFQTAPGTYVFDSNIYDFGNGTLQTERTVMGTDAPPERIGSVFFRLVQGHMGIETAHRALTELGGTPGDLNFALGLDKNGRAIEPEALTHEVQRSNYKASANPIGFRTQWMQNQQPKN